MLLIIDDSIFIKDVSALLINAISTEKIRQIWAKKSHKSCSNALTAMCSLHLVFTIPIPMHNIYQIYGVKSTASGII